MSEMIEPIHFCAHRTTSGSNDAEQAVASYFRLAKAIEKRAKHKPGVHKIVEAVRELREREK